MPTYEYQCEACQHRFSAVQTISEHEREQPECPECGSARVTQLMSAFIAKTSRKS